jgi:hypothetical protein
MKNWVFQVLCFGRGFWPKLAKLGPLFRLKSEEFMSFDVSKGWGPLPLEAA